MLIDNRRAGQGFDFSPWFFIRRTYTLVREKNNFRQRKYEKSKKVIRENV